VGLGNFNLFSARYAHNSYLQFWAETGILGITSLLWLIAAVLKSAIKSVKQSKDKKFMAGLITANAVFLIHNLFDFTFFLPEVSLIWWVIFGYIFCS
jgi:O-antigen ligase